MKKISEHLGQIIVALAAIALLVTAVVVFRAPLGGFFQGIVAKETSIANAVLANMDDIRIEDMNGESGDQGSPIPAGAGSATFYGYLTTPDCHRIITNHTSSCYTLEEVTLSWEQLKLEENATKYQYDCSAISDNNIGEQAFHACTTLTSIEIPSSVTSVGIYAFDCCFSLTSIKLPSNVTSIGEGTFYSCKNLTSIEIPSGVKVIGEIAFEDCTNLTFIKLPSDVTSIKFEALAYCKNLNLIEFSGTKAQWNAISKEEDWNIKVPATEVVCSDGTVALN